MAQQTLTAIVNNAGGGDFRYRWSLLSNTAPCTSVFFTGQDFGTIDADPDELQIVVNFEPDDTCEWFVNLRVFNVNDPTCEDNFVFNNDGPVDNITYMCDDSTETPTCIPVDGLGGSYASLSECLACTDGCTCNPSNPCDNYSFVATYICDETGMTNGSMTVCNTSPTGLNVTITSINVQGGSVLWTGSQDITNATTAGTCHTFTPFDTLVEGVYFLNIEMTTADGCITGTQVMVECGPTISETNIECCEVVTFEAAEQGQGNINNYITNLANVEDTTQDIIIDFAANTVGDKIIVYNGSGTDGTIIAELPYVGDPTHCSTAGTAGTVIQGYLEVEGIFTAVGDPNATQNTTISPSMPGLIPSWSLPPGS